LPMISAGAVALSTVDVVEINFSDQLSGSFVEAYRSSDPDASSPMLAVTGHDERYLMLGGGNADGTAVINITDILKWDTLVGFPDSDHRGGARFSDEGNFNGDDVIDGHDFNIWKRMQSLGVTYAPLP
ncbi:MAG: hypothetical protein P9M08_08800, partial [Candidatus Erginobacter occultus]|nr:hypothetical protein [Candidatus Erginobacter occultus]